MIVSFASSACCPNGPKKKHKAPERQNENFLDDHVCYVYFLQAGVHFYCNIQTGDCRLDDPRSIYNNRPVSAPSNLQPSSFLWYAKQSSKFPDADLERPEPMGTGALVYDSKELDELLDLLDGKTKLK